MDDAPDTTVCPCCYVGRQPPAGRPRDLRRTGGFVAALVLAAYGALVAPSAAARAGGECGALAAQMRALVGERIDLMLAWYGREESGFAEGDAELSGLGLGNDQAPPAEHPLPTGVREAVGSNAVGTNTAEREVDEPDIAKVDGSRILRLWGHGAGERQGNRSVLRDWELSVVETGGDRPRLTGWVKPTLPHDAHEMFVLQGRRVLVVGSVPGGGDDDSGEGGRDRSTVVLTLVDVADPENPAVVRTAKVTGHYVSGRLADGVARIVVTTRAPVSISPPKGFEPTAVAVARNRIALQRKDGQDWLPQREILDARGDAVAAGPALGCADVHRPVHPRGTDILSVLAVDARDGAAALDLAGASGLVGGGDVVYATPDRLYVASGTEAVVDGRWDGRHTTVHAFDTTGRRASPHVGTGVVRGALLGSSALSRHDGHLRVAVTDPRASVSSVHILAEEEAGALREVGRVTDLGPGEQIRSVRWLGPLATVVTFRQTDPFYVLDLARPVAPRLHGELKIPGYSGYLHPVGGGRVLGVGQDADGAGNERGLQVSAFDVTDPAAPRRTDNLVYRGGWGVVQSDSRAFTYLPGNDMAVLPALLRGAGCPAKSTCWSLEGTPPGRATGGLAGRSGVGAAVGVRVDEDGGLREVARFLSDGAVVRVLPVGGRLAAITATSVVLLTAEDLFPIGHVVLDPRR